MTSLMTRAAENAGTLDHRPCAFRPFAVVGFGIDRAILVSATAKKIDLVATLAG